MMKILLLSTSDQSGGAAIACRRLFEALVDHPQMEVRMLVQEVKNPHPQIRGWVQSSLGSWRAWGRFLWERLRLWPKLSRKEFRFAFSPADTGVDISQHPWVKEADVIHVHWINFGFLSLSSLEKLSQLKKVLVWTLQDMWAFTGGCHYAGDCQNYQQSCGNCFYLKNSQPQDYSHQIWKKKQAFYSQANFLVSPTSAWLSKCAQESSLFPKDRVQHIPAPIDPDQFQPGDKGQARLQKAWKSDDFLLLFGAASLKDPRKGFQYLKNALKQLSEDQTLKSKNIRLVVFGKFDQASLENIPYPIENLGTVDLSTLTQVYQAVDVFVMPSLEDNLPNTVLEALACGTPVVAFHSGGIPEMVEHKKNGYLAEYKSASDLKSGIAFILASQAEPAQVPYDDMAQSARLKIMENYHPALIRERYWQLYQSLLKES